MLSSGLLLVVGFGLVMFLEVIKSGEGKEKKEKGKCNDNIVSYVGTSLSDPLGIFSNCSKISNVHLENALIIIVNGDRL